MDQSPYKFDSSNPRLVSNVAENKTVYYAAGALFLLSMRFYHKNIFRINERSADFAAFTVGSLFSSYAIANFALDSATNQAGLLNNQIEQQTAKH